MKSKLLVLILSVGVIFSLNAFAYSADRSHGQPERKYNVGNQQDGEIIATLIFLNRHEIAAANEAEKRRVSPVVRKYAYLLHKDHGKNLRDTLKLSQEIGVRPIETQNVILLEQKGDKELSALKSLNNQQFEVVYIDSMIKGHEDALNKINNAMAQTQNPALKKHLSMTRDAVASHLQMARMIRNKLNTNS